MKSADPTQNCDNGFCFRGMEKIYEIMRDHGYGHEKIWATEVGWITQPADSTCLNDPTWAGRAWQRVSAEKQAANLAGAFRYARTNYPWLAAMFVFNLNFDSAPWYHGCEQMRFYSIQSTTAAGAMQGVIQEASRFVYLPLIHE